ncbi:MAG: hypothetical protein JEZ11_24400 [Desulfobacterales bacterium]|nr:hypothetical protein [Desulfobacterales bacterium]
MERSYNISKNLKFFIASIFLSVFALAGSAVAQDCPIPSRTVDVGGVSISASGFEAVKDGLSGRSHSGDGAYAETDPGVEVGASQVAKADVRAIRDLVAGNAEFSAFGSGREAPKTVSVGLAEVSQEEFSGVRDGVGKVSPASVKSSDCA